MRKLVLVFGMMVIFTGYTPVQADKDYMGNLGVVVVTPTRNQSRIDDLGTNVDVITKDDINQYNAHTVAEALENVAGIPGVSERGTRGTTRDMRIRSGGNSSKQVLVMIDGQPVNDIGLGSADLEEIPVDYVDRIEIVRGPSSAIYGANALGGVVNIITKKPVGNKPSVKVNIEEGVFASSKYNLQVQYNDGKNRSFASLSDEDSAGWRENSGYNGNDFILKAGKTIDNFGDIDGQFIYSKSEFGVPGQNTTSISDYDGDIEKTAQSPDANIDKTRQRLQIGSSNKLNDNISLKTRLYGSLSDKAYENPGAYTDDLFETMSYGVELQGCISSDLVVGGNIAWDEFVRKDEYTAPAVTDIDKNTINRAVFVQQTLDSGPATFILGLRYDAHSVYEGQLNPQTTIIYRLLDELKLSANVGRAFRAPTFEDMYSPQTFWPASMFGPAGDTMGNTDLKPETAWGYDIGVEHQFGKILLSRLTFFRSDIDNLIEWAEVDPDPNYNKWRPSNVGKAYNQGFEAGIDYRVFGKLDQSINYTYLESKGKDEDDPEFATLQYTPANKINYKLSYPVPGDIKLSAGLYYTGKIDWEDDFGILYKLDEYIVVNAGVSRKIYVAELFFNIKNIFDEEYQTRENYPLPGRIYNAGVSLTF
ncbi:TonB-dependent receptor plug domain-containing protein [Elusimicrobiota bacterium]